MMNWGYGWNGYGGSWYPLMHFAWWLLIVAVVVALIFWNRGSNARGSGEDRALNILRERYARGEIAKEEFEERLQILKGR